MQEGLRLIDDALDRLMAGTYGDCVVCGKWIEDNKLHADPALPFCCGCKRRSETKHVAQTAETKVGAGVGDAVIRVTLTTICGTDLHIVRGWWTSPNIL